RGRPEADRDAARALTPHGDDPPAVSPVTTGGRDDLLRERRGPRKLGCAYPRSEGAARDRRRLARVRPAVHGAPRRARAPARGMARRALREWPQSVASCCRPLPGLASVMPHALFARR